jgi:hypothetical protein
MKKAPSGAFFVLDIGVIGGLVGGNPCKAFSFPVPARCPAARQSGKRHGSAQVAAE